MEKNEAVVIRAAHYDEAVARLVADPIVQRMAAEIPAGVDTSRYGFMLGALREYQRRGGQVDCHIGGVQEAIDRLRADA